VKSLHDGMQAPEPDPAFALRRSGGSCRPVPARLGKSPFGRSTTLTSPLGASTGPLPARLRAERS
jgi:hypothetical protein